jgi:hypothetical protein
LRKFIGAVAVAALAVGVTAIPASATFDPQFSVIAKQTSGHNVGPNEFRAQGKLLNPRNRGDKVGRYWLDCKFKPNIEKLRCRALAHLNGQIGGFGNIRVSGDIRPPHGNRRLNVVSGTHDFTGVAGKVLVRNLHEKNSSRLRFTLTR